MYLAHFGITEPPFRITPITEFFFTGANRGEILEALIYSICEVEGIVKVSGEVGSGKTMLCRMLLEKLPENVESVYLANPSLSREEMLYAIADGLGLTTTGERVGVIMSMIQSKLEEMASEGKRVVVLVDEAHAMPLDTLEELRLLYNLQTGNSKLLQIVLFGQPELNAKLDQPNMRQLKDRIVHHFNMQPLSRDILENYLMFRMRAAGYRGPNIFSSDAVKLIAKASNGLMRRTNILADKALLAAFVEDTYYIKAHHVRTALRDSELDPIQRPARKAVLLTVIATTLFLLAGSAAWWMMQQTEGVAPFNSPKAKPSSVSLVEPSIAAVSNTSAVVAAPITTKQTSSAKVPTTPTDQPPTSNVTTKKPDPISKPEISENTNKTIPPPTSPQKITPTTSSTPEVIQTILFEQRMAAGKQLIKQKSAVASIQLFYNESVNAERIERFLSRADKLGKLHEIYLLPIKFGRKDGLRVLYGSYPSVDAARKATNTLPKRYREAFATSIHIF